MHTHFHNGSLKALMDKSKNISCSPVITCVTVAILKCFCFKIHYTLNTKWRPNKLP